MFYSIMLYIVFDMAFYFLYFIVNKSWLVSSLFDTAEIAP